MSQGILSTITPLEEAEHIGRRTVAFFFLTSLANVGGVILFAAPYAVGILHHDRNPL